MAKVNAGLLSLAVLNKIVFFKTVAEAPRGFF
jgi:hypothetical protein